MSKRCRDPDSDGTTAAASGFKTVFVATSLDTHLALTLSFSDTVADFKKKILLYHEQCFPKIGALTIHSLKVKYQGKLYHLHESDMVVSSAFEGYEGRWSLLVDASSSFEDVKEQSSLDPRDKGKLESPRVLQAIDAIAWKSPGESSRHTGLEVGNVGGTSREGFSSIVSQNLVENDLRSKDDSKDHNEKVHYHTPYETRSGDGLKAKKKQVKKSLHVAGESVLNTALQTTTIRRSNDETTGIEDSFVGAGSKVSRDVQIDGASPYNTLFSGKKTSKRAAPESHVFEQEEVYRHHLDLSIRNQVSDMENLAPEKSVMDRRENMTSYNVPSEQLHEEQPAINTTTKKKKRQKQHKGTNSRIPDDQAATSKSGTMLQGSVLQEPCGSQDIGTGNYVKEDDQSMLAPTSYFENDYKEKDGRLTSNHDMWLSESVKPSDIVEATPAKKELVLCLGILNNFPEAADSGGSKSKIRKARKPAMEKQDQLDIKHDLSARSGISAAIEGVAVEAHIEDESKRGENVLSQNDPNKSEQNSELAKNHVHLNEKELASDVALTLMENSEGGKSGCSQKKKKRKKSASKNDYCVVERTKDATDSLVLKIASDVMVDQSLFSSIKEKEASKMFSPTNSPKNHNTASDDDNVHFPLTEVDHIYSKNKDFNLNSGKESNINQSQDKATIHDQVNMEQAKEAEGLPMDQPDKEVKNKGTTKKKKKKKANRTGNSTGEGLYIPEVNQQTMDLEEVAPLIVKLGNVDNHADTLKVSESDEKTTIDRSGVSELGPGKKAGLKSTGEPEQLLQNADSPEVPPHEIGSNCEVGHATVVGMPNNALASEGDNGSVNFRRYFVPGEDHIEAASTDKVEGESNVVEGADKADEHTIVPEGKHRPSKAWENQKNSSGINSDDNKHEYSSLKAKQRKNVSEKEISASSKKSSVATNSSDVKIQTLKRSVEPTLMNGSVSMATVPRHLEEKDESLTSSTFNSISRDSKKVLLNKSNQKKQTGIHQQLSRKKESDLDKSSQEKGLFTTPGVIFGDGVSESSGDENGILKSGSTTLSPSDSSSSSGDSMMEESNNSARVHKGRKTALSSKIPDPGSMPIDMIFKSSSRFKKAKLNASQSEAADSESQQVDFVPESQPIN